MYSIFACGLSNFTGLDPADWSIYPLHIIVKVPQGALCDMGKWSDSIVILCKWLKISLLHPEYFSMFLVSNLTITLNPNPGVNLRRGHPGIFPPPYFCRNGGMPPYFFWMCVGIQAPQLFFFKSVWPSPDWKYPGSAPVTLTCLSIEYSIPSSIHPMQNILWL